MCDGVSTCMCEGVCVCVIRVCDGVSTCMCEGVWCEDVCCVCGTASVYGVN